MRQRRATAYSAAARRVLRRARSTARLQGGGRERREGEAAAAAASAAVAASASAAACGARLKGDAWLAFHQHCTLRPHTEAAHMTLLPWAWGSPMPSRHRPRSSEVGQAALVPLYLQLHLHPLRVSRVDEWPLDHEAQQASEVVGLDVDTARRQRVDPVPPGYG